MKQFAALFGESSVHYGVGYQGYLLDYLLGHLSAANGIVDIAFEASFQIELHQRDAVRLQKLFGFALRESACKGIGVVALRQKHYARHYAQRQKVLQRHLVGVNTGSIAVEE